MRVLHHNFFLPFSDLFLLSLSVFFCHSISWYEDGVEIVRLWESLLRRFPVYEIWFAVKRGLVLLAFQNVFGESFLFDARVFQVCDFACIWLQWVFVPITLLTNVIETFLSSPPRNAFQLLLKLDFVLVDQREGSTHIVLRVCVEVFLILLDHFT